MKTFFVVTAPDDTDVAEAISRGGAHATLESAELAAARDRAEGRVHIYKVVHVASYTRRQPHG